MKTTITWKEFRALSSGAVQVTHATAPTKADSQPQRMSESVRHFNVPPDRSDESFREMQHRRYTMPFPVAFPYQHGGINE